MWWIIVLAVIGGLLLLGIILLLIPLDLSWQLEVYGKPRSRLRWAWLFGGISREIKPGQRAPQKEKTQRKIGISQVIKGIRIFLDFLRIKGLINQLQKFMKGAFHSIKIRDLEAWLHVGLDDPAETFYLFAATEPINRIFDYTLPYPVHIQPAFEEAVFEGYFNGAIRVYPIRLIPPLAQLVFSAAAFRVVRKVVVYRWRRSR
jgi:hypothetical protein